MDNLQSFREQVSLKYQLYNGLFLTLPFDEIRTAGILLPMFAEYCRSELEHNRSPIDIVQDFFAEYVTTSRALPEGAQIRPDVSFEEMAATLFKFMQFVERQVVLFDALEDASYGSVRDLDGAGSLRELFTKVETEGAVEEFRKRLAEFKVRVVLTAHPTQFYPDEVLTIITDMHDVISRNDLKGVNDLLLQMGKTRFKNKERPTPLDEAKSLLYFMEHTFYEAIPQIHQRLVNFAYHPDELAQPDPEALHLSPPISLGFWPGGDRDGNPFVTAELTIQIGRLLRSRILALYLSDLEQLRRRLTFEGVIERIEMTYSRMRTTLYPYEVVNTESLQDPTYCEDVDDLGYDNADQFLSDLLAIRAEVVGTHQGLFVAQLDLLIYKVQIFGFHFATMDIRQDSRIHGKLVEELISLLSNYAGGSPSDRKYTELGPEERLEVLENLATLFPLSRNIAEELPEGISRETILSLQAALRMQRLIGERGMHRYIISNTRNAANVLEVWLLAQCAGWSHSSLTLDIVPLFETVDDLHHAEAVMESLYSLPVYRRHLEARGSVQTIMVGFSDGTKDGGYATANWEIYRAKERLSEVSRRYGIKAIFFDGRGGPPARGGGNTHRFYRSLGSRVESRQIHITVQGQTISSKYGTADQARHNLEQLYSSGMSNNLFPRQNYELTDEDIAIIDELSRVSNEAYLALKRHPLLTRYLTVMTPLLYYGHANISSRPTSRNQSSELKLEDLRAIPFVGAWSQIKQNVPGYYGLGSGIRELVARGKKDELIRLYRKSLFFRTLVENASQSLSKTNFSLTNHMKDDAEFGELWSMIRREARLTVDGILQISGGEDLLQGDRVTRESIALREQMVLPTQVIQQYALAMIRTLGQEGDDSPTGHVSVLQKMVIKSLAASINASRNAV